MDNAVNVDERDIHLHLSRGVRDNANSARAEEQFRCDRGRKAAVGENWAYEAAHPMDVGIRDAVRLAGCHGESSMDSFGWTLRRITRAPLGPLHGL